MLGNVPRGETLAGHRAVGALGMQQRSQVGAADERGAGAVLRAGAAVGLLFVVLRDRGMLVFAVVVDRCAVRPALLPAGSADADRDRRDTAQRYECEHRTDEQELKGAFHGAGC